MNSGYLFLESSICLCGSAAVFLISDCRDDEFEHRIPVQGDTSEESQSFLEVVTHWNEHLSAGKHNY